MLKHWTGSSGTPYIICRNTGLDHLAHPVQGSIDLVRPGARVLVLIGLTRGASAGVPPYRSMKLNDRRGSDGGRTRLDIRHCSVSVETSQPNTAYWARHRIHRLLGSAPHEAGARLVTESPSCPVNQGHFLFFK